MKNRYCKKCGNELNPKTRLCNNCGKQYFKFRGVHVINLVVIVIMIVMGYGLYDLNSQCNILQSRCDSLQETNNELSDSLKKAQTTSKAPTTKNWREEGKKSLKIEAIMINLRNKMTVAAIKKKREIISILHLSKTGTIITKKR